MSRIQWWHIVFWIECGCCLLGSCVSTSRLAPDANEIDLTVGTPGAVNYPEQSLSTDGESPSAVADAGGCTHDIQCKADRVCIARTCVSPKYADEYEAQYMASAGVINNDAYNGDPVVDISVPPEDGKLLCNKPNVAQCMEKCEHGDMEGCYAVGKVYQTAISEPDHVRYSLYAYRKACDGGHGVSCVILSRMYFVGQVVQRNFSISFRLNVEGCHLKNSNACANTALLLENGLGVEKDVPKSTQFYTTACLLGHNGSCAKAKGTDE